MSLVNLISGSPGKNNLENRIFNTACFTACILFCVATLTNFINGISILGITSNIVGFSLYATIYYFSKVKSTYRVLIMPTCFLTMVALAHFWFVFDGLNGSVTLAALLALVAFISVLHRKYHLFISIMVAITITVLFIIDYNYPELSTPFPTRLARYVDVGMVFLICNMLIATMISLFKKSYEEERSYVEKKNQELKKSQAELIQAKEVAEKAAEAKTEFLTTMSHELRTPMNAVIGISHILLNNEPKSDQVKNIETLKTSSEHLMRLINDILDFSKIESGKVEFENVNFSLTELCYSLQKTMEHKVEEKGIGFKCSMDEDIPDLINGDITRLGQILNNLLSNAVKFTNDGEIITSVKLKEKTEEYAKIAFSVKDSGIGISKEQQQFIFEDFMQANSDTTRKYGGTGLGLAITKKLIELQGSTIHIESEMGKGTEFYFDLVFKNPVKKGKKASAILSEPKLVPMEDTYILVAEDDKINVMVIEQFLNEWNVNFDHAENGKKALEFVEKNNYDLVLMDLQMPVMNGYEATANIRKLSENKYQDLPIIALTASALLETQHKAFEVGMTDYVSKPFNPNELYTKIVKYKSA